MVRWTAHAKAQLRHIHDYIAEDSPLYAKRVTAELVQQYGGAGRFAAQGKEGAVVERGFGAGVVAVHLPHPV